MFSKYTILALVGLTAISYAAPLSSNQTSMTTALDTGSHTEPTRLPCWESGTCKREEETTDLARGPCWESGTCKRDDDFPDVVTGLPCWKAGTCKRDAEAAARVASLPCWKVGTCKRGETVEDSAVPSSLVSIIGRAAVPTSLVGIVDDAAVPSSLVSLPSARAVSDSPASSTASVQADPTPVHPTHGNIPVVAVREGETDTIFWTREESTEEGDGTFWARDSTDAANNDGENTFWARDEAATLGA